MIVNELKTRNRIYFFSAKKKESPPCGADRLRQLHERLSSMPRSWARIRKPKKASERAPDWMTAFCCISAPPWSAAWSPPSPRCPSISSRLDFKTKRFDLTSALKVPDKLSTLVWLKFAKSAKRSFASNYLELRFLTRSFASRF